MIHEPPDLRELDESDQYREVYAWAGLAFYQVQVLEQGVIQRILFARATDNTLVIDFETTDDFFDAQAKKTLGQLLRDLGKHISLPVGVEADLQEALSRRNFLAHRFFSERIGLFVTLSGRQRLVAELADAARLFRTTDEQLTEVMFLLSQRFGVTPEAVEQELVRWNAEMVAASEA